VVVILALHYQGPINAETTGKILVTKEYVTGLTGNGIVTGGTYTAGTAVFRNNTWYI
jgi:hypothetical protein